MKVSKLHVLFFFLCIALVNVNGQSVSELTSHYSGQISWDDASKTVTFLTTGTINFPDKLGTGNDPVNGYKMNYWAIPTSVKKVVINEDVTVTGAFHTYANCLIEGKNRKTSVVFGTSEKRWADNRNLDEWHYAQFQNWNGTLSVRNLTALNPFSYFIRGWGKVNHLKKCDFIDNRGGFSNHSDGFSGGSGSTVDSCYFETGDDAIKLYFDIKVTNCTINMILNCVPFQFGWGTYQDSYSELRNITIIGNNGRNSNNPVFEWKSGSDKKTVVMSNINIVNPNADIFDLEPSTGTLNLDMTDSYIKVKSYGTTLNAKGTRTICGTTAQRNTYDCLFQGLSIPGVIQAEDYYTMNGVVKESCSDVGGGENISGIDNGDWLEYLMNVETPGEYVMKYRYASVTENVKFDLMSGSKVIASANTPASGGAQTWETDSLIVDLTSGIQSLNILAKGSGWKLNWLEFSKKPILPNVENLKMSVVSSKALKLSWTENVTNEVGFVVERSLAGLGQFMTIDTTIADTTHYIDSVNLEPFTKYDYRVRTLFANDISQASNEVIGRTSVQTHAAMPEGWSNTSLGDTLVAMASTSTFSNDTFTIHAGDGDFWDVADRGHFIYKQFEGDCDIIAEITDFDAVQEWTMAGVMIRDSLIWGSKFAAMLMLPAPGPIVRVRSADGGAVAQEFSMQGANFPYWVRLKRVGNQFSGFTSPDGISWKSIRSVAVDMDNKVYVGMAANSHTIDTCGRFSFANVDVSEPKNEYTVNVTANQGGSVSPSANMLVLEGTNLEYMITANNDYIINDVEIDGISQGAIAKVNLNGISANHTINVIFAKDNTPIQSQKQDNFKVYPNPVSQLLNVELAQFKNAVIELYSIDGVKLFTRVADEKSTVLDLSGQKKGLYLLGLTIDGKTSFTTVVVE